MSMMVRSLILVCLICTSVSAVELRKNRPGGVLIFPFFNATNGWDTYIDLYAGNEAQVLKIHIREGRLGALVRSFNYYNYKGQPENLRLAISKNANNDPVLIVAEGGCVIADDLTAGGAGSVFELRADIGTLEVYAITARLTSHSSGSFSSCEDLADSWRPGGIWDSDPLDGIQESSESLIIGSATLIKVEDGVATDYEPLILGEFSQSIAHTSPSSMSPNLADADPVTTLPDGTQYMLPSGEGIDAVAAVIGIGDSATLTNQVITAPSVNASTDWIVSYPLAGYKQYRPFSVQIDGEARACETLGRAPESGLDFIPRDPLVGAKATVEVPSTIAYTVLSSWGGGSTGPSPDADLDPLELIEVSVHLCNAINVIGFQGYSRLLEPSSEHYYFLEVPLADSNSSIVRWALIDPKTNYSVGRPVLAYRLTIFRNGAVPVDDRHVLANYATLRQHNLDR